MDCNCYCGVGTKANKLKWATVATLGLAGLIVTILAVKEAILCGRYSDRLSALLRSFRPLLT
jgi:hypothetical protein